MPARKNRWKRSALIAMLLLISLMSGCAAPGEDVAKEQAAAVESALARQLRAADPRYIAFAYDDVFTQLADQPWARRAPLAYNYEIEIRVPVLASMPDGAIPFQPPAPPADGDGLASEETITRYARLYQQAYYAAVLEAMHAGSAQDYTVHTILVTVEWIDGRWLASKPFVGWIREDIRAQLREMLDASMEASADVQRLRLSGIAQ